MKKFCIILLLSIETALIPMLAQNHVKKLQAKHREQYISQLHEIAPTCFTSDSHQITVLMRYRFFLKNPSKKDFKKSSLVFHNHKLEALLETHLRTLIDTISLKETLQNRTWIESQFSASHFTGKKHFGGYSIVLLEIKSFQYSEEIAHVLQAMNNLEQLKYKLKYAKADLLVDANSPEKAELAIQHQIDSLTAYIVANDRFGLSKE